jgi:hypothetical protein
MVEEPLAILTGTGSASGKLELEELETTTDGVVAITVCGDACAGASTFCVLELIVLVIIITPPPEPPLIAGVADELETITLDDIELLDTKLLELDELDERTELELTTTGGIIVGVELEDIMILELEITTVGITGVRLELDLTLELIITLELETIGSVVTTGAGLLQLQKHQQQSGL